VAFVILEKDFCIKLQYWGIDLRNNCRLQFLVVKDVLRGVHGHRREGCLMEKSESTKMHIRSMCQDKGIGT
jgi:hypothetical protein